MFRTCSRINYFHIYAFYRNRGHDGSLYDCLLDSIARVKSIDDKAVFVSVGDVNGMIAFTQKSHSEWLESVSTTDRHGVMLFIFAICQVLSSWFAVPLTLLVTNSI